MGKEDGSGTGGDSNTSQSSRPVPPPEAFQHSESFGFQPDQIKSHHDSQPENEESTRKEIIATSIAMTGAQRPLIRRKSSLFGQLPVRRRSRLFDDILPSSSNIQNKKQSNAVVDNIVAETMTNFSHSQPTWLQDDHQSTFFMEESKNGDTSSQFNQPPTRSQAEQRPGEKSSLFGAVMRQFGSSISSALPPSSPFGRRKTSGTAGTSPSNGNGGNGSFRDLMSSPSGKTIMNIVNQFNSPFKFQSPSSSHKKRQRRRRLWKDEDDDDSKDSHKSENEQETDKDDFYTPKKRRRLDEDDENSKQSSNILFPDHDANDSRSSLGGGLVDEHWREAPIVDMGDEIQMEILDWSLITKVRIEAHGGNSEPISDSWILDLLRDNEEKFAFWMYQSRIVTDDFTSNTQTSGILARSTSNLSVLQKSIGASRASMSRQGSFGSRLEAKLASGKSKTGNKKDDEVDTSSSVNLLAKRLIQSVRGPDAKYSRKRVLNDDCWWDEQKIQTTTKLEEDSGEQSRRQWQQALRSLFSKYRRRVLCNRNQEDSLNAMILDTYFYCIGRDHSVLCRIAGGEETDDDPVPMVLVSSTSDSFRKQLESNGLDLNQGSEGEESFELLESIQQREARERQRIIAATAAASRKSKQMFNSLVSPSVRADLEALRRAQAFGQSAGADVMVKVKEKSDGADEDANEKDDLPKGMKLSGWDNVSLFFEVYLNLFGDVMAGETVIETAALPFLNVKATNKILPLLVCPNAFEPFDHASLKKLSLFPAEKVSDNGSQSKEKRKDNESTENHSNTMEIRGIILPSAMRKILLVTRERILNDDRYSRGGSIKLESSGARANHDDADSSRYVVLHSSRPSIINRHKELPKSWIGGMNGTLIFNQGKKRKTKRKRANSNEHRNDNNNEQDQVFECSYGNVVSMAVWDTSREEVAACKQDDAFPENWIHKK